MQCWFRKSSKFLLHVVIGGLVWEGIKWLAAPVGAVALLWGIGAVMWLFENSEFLRLVILSVVVFLIVVLVRWDTVIPSQSEYAVKKLAAV